MQVGRLRAVVEARRGKRRRERVTRKMVGGSIVLEGTRRKADGSGLSGFDDGV